MTQIFIVIAPLFIIIFASALLQKFTKIGEAWSDVLNAFAFKIGLPVLIFTALAQAKVSFTTEGKIIVLNSLFIIGSLVLIFLVGKLLRLKQQNFNTLFICFVFGNVAYLGLPVLVQTAGVSILPTASVIVAVYLFWLFIIGIGYLDYVKGTNRHQVVKHTLLGIVKNPLLLAVVLGILVNIFNLNLPFVFLSALDMISMAVTPAVLIVIGLFIGKSTFGKFKDWLPVIIFSLATLILLPAGLFFGLKILGIPPMTFSSSIIQAAMPLAITPFALADQYNLNKDFIARSVVLSTILAVLSLPFWLWVLN